MESGGHLRLMDEMFDHYRLDLEKVVDCPGDHVVALLCQRGSINGTDSEIEQQIAYDVEIHDGAGDARTGL